MLSQLLQHVQRQHLHSASGRTEARSAGARCRTIHFDQYSIDLETGELRRDGKRVDLQPQATTALQLLLRRPRRLVTHDELRQAIWGNTTVEWDAGLEYVWLR